MFDSGEISGYLNNKADGDDVWRGLGSNFESLAQIIAEFVDNSLSNIIGNKLENRNIIINLIPIADETDCVTIEDEGTGISNLDNAFSIGGQKSKDTPFNEHGYGMKHALAAANISNDNWHIYTRTDDDWKNQKYKEIRAPYMLDDLPVRSYDVRQTPWPGQNTKSGTFVKFHCSRDMFETLRKGVPGHPSYKSIVGYLEEKIGFTYSGLIQSNQICIKVGCEGNAPKAVPPVLPNWEELYSPGKGETEYNLGNGDITLKYTFGAIQASNYLFYYERNLSSLGLEIRMNGRVIEHNIFKDVWDLVPANEYNHFLVIVDLISDNQNRLPSTKTSKNGFRQGSPLLEELYQWVKQMLPKPPDRKVHEERTEKDLVNKLREREEAKLQDPKKIIPEFSVFNKIGGKELVDLYVSHEGKLILYEAKKDESILNDIYQLKKYWDGATLDGHKPTKGILIARKHSKLVRDVITYINEMADINGNNYEFHLTTWEDEGISTSQ